MPQLDEIDLLDIQAKLRADASGAERDALDRRLEELGLTIKRKLDAGAAPAEFTALSAMHGAAEAAREVVATAWSRLHPGR